MHVHTYVVVENRGHAQNNTSLYVRMYVLLSVDSIILLGVMDWNYRR